MLDRILYVLDEIWIQMKYSVIGIFNRHPVLQDIFFYGIIIIIAGFILTTILYKIRRKHH
jgi:hypothetical protein